MSDQAENAFTDEEFWAAKRKRQQACFDAMARGERTQESMYIFDIETAHKGTVIFHTIVVESLIER